MQWQKRHFVFTMSSMLGELSNDNNKKEIFKLKGLTTKLILVVRTWADM